MKKILSILAASAAVFGLSVSCTDLTEIEQRLDKVESDIAALQTQVSQLNDNADLLEALTNATIIKEIRQENGVTTIVTNDNREFEIKDGEKGDPGKTPELSIDEEGNWCVRFGEDEEWIELGKSTPEFSMKDGYWMVKYGDGEFKQLLDPDGNPIEVGTGGVAFDWEINEDGDEFTMTLTDPEDGSERKIVIPILGDKFSVTIDKSGLSPVEGKEGIFQLEYGKVISVPVTINGLVGDKFEITAPEGWTVQLDDADDQDETTYKLLVAGRASSKMTSPATKAVIGSTETDVVLKIFSDTYGTAMDKVRFEMVGEATYNPVISKIECTGTVNGALVFNVVYQAATGYKYILLAEGAEAPSVEQMKALATSSSDNTLSLKTYTDGETEKPVELFGKYVLYALAYADGDIYATEIKQATATVDDPDVKGLYRDYMMGQDITVAGRTINKATYGTALLISGEYEMKGVEKVTETKTEWVPVTDAAGNSIKVYFVEPGAVINHTYIGSYHSFIMIGNESDGSKKSTFNISKQIKLNQGKLTAGTVGDGTFIIKGMTITADALDSNYPLAQNNDGAYGTVSFIDCNIEFNTSSLTYISTPARTINEFLMEDCDYKTIGKSGEHTIISLSSSTGTYNKLTFKNNIFYSPADAVSKFKFVNGNKASIGEFTAERNTLVNIWGDSNWMIYCDNVYGFTATNNLAYCDGGGNSGLLRCTKQAEKYPTIIKVSTNGYYVGEASTSWKIFFDKDLVSSITEENYMDSKKFYTTSNPFEGEGAQFDLTNGIFVPNDKAKDYGAQR